MKYLFFFTAIISLLFCDDNSNIISESYNFSNNEIIIDSTDYKNNQDLDTLIQKKLYHLSFNFGKTISIDKDEYGQGNSIGFCLFLPYEIYLGNDSLNTAIELNFSDLSGSSWEGDANLNSINFILNKNILTFSKNNNTIPLINIGLGVGVLDHSRWGIMSSILMDFNYRIPNDKYIMNLNLRLQKAINLTEEYELDFSNHSHNLYGINFNFGKKLQLRK